MDFDEIRLREADELNDEEKKLLVEHSDDLTDEEKEAFKTILDTSGEDDKSQGETKDEKGDETKGQVVFENQEAFDTAVAEAANKALEARDKAKADAEKAKADEAEVDQVPDFFPAGYKAKDWNEAFKTAAPKLIDEAVKKIQTLSTKQRERFDEVNKQFDDEIETLAKTDTSIPKKGTAERETFDSELAQIGVDYKLVTMTDSYKVWKALKVESKGGDDTKGDESVSEDQNAGARQKALAAKIGKSGGTGGVSKELKYSRLSRSMDDLMEEEMAKAGIE